MYCSINIFIILLWSFVSNKAITLRKKITETFIIEVKREKLVSIFKNGIMGSAFYESIYFFLKYIMVKISEGIDGGIIKYIIINYINY